MNVKIKLVDPSLPMPEYKTKGSVAFDIYSRIDMEIPPFTPTYVPTNLIVKIPKGHFLMMASRSSLHKTGLMLANGIGVFDHDFCGDNDEMIMIMLNFTKKTVKVERGQRLAQGLFVKISLVEKFNRVKKNVFNISWRYWFDRKTLSFSNCYHLIKTHEKKNNYFRKTVS